MPRINKDAVIASAHQRWPEILQALTRIPPEALDNRHQPCPNCGGTDRYRFDDKTGNGEYYCNQCGAGDGLSLVMKLNGWDFHEALTETARHLGYDVGETRKADVRRTAAPASSKPKARARKVKQISPIPMTAPDPDFNHPKHGKPVASWTYEDGNGRALHYIARYEVDGGKEIIPWVYGYREGDEQPRWWMRAPESRVLWNLPEIIGNPNASVLIVEGEKAAAAARELLPDVVVTTWAGGSKALHLVEWGPLDGRRVAVWPDADEEGRQTIEGWLRKGGKFKEGLVDLIGERVEILHAVKVPPGVADKWDLADALAGGWTKEETRRHLKANLYQPKSARPDFRDKASPKDPIQGDDSVRGRTKAEIRPLGVDAQNRLVLWPRGLNRIVHRSVSGLGKLALLELADLAFWEQNYADNSGVAWVNATDSVARLARASGSFDPDRVRGRGAWWDAGRVILHCGDRAFIDGERTDLRDVPSERYIYTSEPPMRGPSTTPMTDKDAAEVLSLFKGIRWRNPAFALLAAGWTVLAPICGALRWRPHAWLTGPSGSGKSTVVSRLIQPLLGGSGLLVQGGTSEAGLRQHLHSDALPIIFDEAEQNERRDQDRLQGLLSLMRQASTESDAVQIKGSADGTASTYRIRSAFCLASIVPGVKQLADESRISQLELAVRHGMTVVQRKEEEDRWSTLNKWLDEITDETGRDLMARTLKLVPVIRHNAEVFARVLAREFGQRTGDQVGHLLAGAHSLTTQAQILEADAAELVSRFHFEEEDRDDLDADEVRCLQAIMQHRIRYDRSSGSQITRSIGEILEVVVSSPSWPAGGESYAGAAILGAAGIRVVAPDRIYIANKSTELAKALDGTPWANGHGALLRRLPDATKHSACRFSPGLIARGTSLSITATLGEKPADGAHEGLAGPAL